LLFHFRVCDHDYDCGGGDTSDETADCGQSYSMFKIEICSKENLILAARPCPAGKFKCASGHCISNTSRCDGYAQCGDASDEAGCPPRFPDGRYCPIDRFTCNNTICISQNWVCDGGRFKIFLFK
jgi:low density lipoprotein-related protein 2